LRICNTSADERNLQGILAAYIIGYINAVEGQSIRISEIGDRLWTELFRAPNLRENIRYTY